jgi:hypothetical protein
MGMWVLESFATVELLLRFLNERRVRADRCKVVAARDAAGGQVFHLLLQAEDDGDGGAAVVEAGEAIGAGEAVDAAEAIVAGAQRQRGG